MMWWIAATALSSEPPVPWTVGRWRVASETLDPNAPLALVVERRELLTRAWQVEAVLDCRRAEVQGAGWVACRIEEAALRVATYDHWQRDADRAIVDTMLEEVRAELRKTRLWLQGRGRGNVVVDSKKTPGRLAPVVLEGVVEGFHLEAPPDGWRDGATWPAASEPLFATEVVHTQQSARAEHALSLTGDRALVTTLGAATLEVFSEPRDPLELRSTRWRRPRLFQRGDVDARCEVPLPPTGAVEAGLGLSGRVEVRAQATIDLETRQLVERRWTVIGTGAAERLRSGRVRRIARDAEISLGPTGQVSPPDAARPDLPSWTPILGLP